MPDSYILSFGGTQVEIATFTDAGVDFGSLDLLKAAFVEGPHTEGQLAYEQVGVRHMVFPLIQRASLTLPNLGLADSEALLRKLARPGATLDVKPHGATIATRFDVLVGRYDFSYNVRQNREGVRVGRLALDTEPYGYWPTQYILGSAASIGLPGVLAFTGSVLGDAPALLEIAIAPTGATNFATGTWYPDMLAWSVAAAPSFVAFLQASALASAVPGTVASDGYAPGGNSLVLYPPASQYNWQLLAFATIPSAIEPAYRGRFRAFAWARVAPSQTPWGLSIDAAQQIARSFASYAPVATVEAGVGSGVPGDFAQPSPALSLIDLGDLTLPPSGSGLPQSYLLRVWGDSPVGGTTIASAAISLGGLYLLPASHAGVLARGLAQPSIGVPSSAVPTVGRLVVDGNNRRAVIALPGNDLATTVPLADGVGFHYGGFPQAGIAARQLDILGGGRRGSLSPVPSYSQAVRASSPKAYYRFEQTSGASIVDDMGSWAGSWAVQPSLGDAGINNSAAPLFSAPSGHSAVIASVWPNGNAATSWSVAMLVKRGAFTASHVPLLSQGQADFGNVPLGWKLYFNRTTFALTFHFVPTNNQNFILNGGAWPPGDATYHHLVANYAHGNYLALWKDASLIASMSASFLATTASGYVLLGAVPSTAGFVNTAFYDGNADELSFMLGTAVGSDVIAPLYRAVSQPSVVNPPTGPVVQSAPLFASVSVRATPRFQFIKGL